MLVLKNDNVWCTEQTLLKDHAVDYFKNLFSSVQVNSLVSSDLCQTGQHYVLNNREHNSLTKRVEYWETTKALKSMKPFKALGPDGFQPIFFQKYWDIVRPNVHKLVIQAFETGDFDSDVNDTLLVLIPKVGNPEEIKQFRPISLCNVFYKISSKVLVNHLKPIMCNPIHPLQTSFVSGRQVADNIIIAQELVDNIKKSKAKNGGMMLKLDLEKTYDKVENSCCKLWFYSISQLLSLILYSLY